MRLPAVTMAAAFACGIVFGLHPAVPRNASSRALLFSSFAAAIVLVFAGMTLLRIRHLFPAAAASFLSWVLLGFVGACIAEQP